MINSLAELKRALQPGAVVTMMAWDGHPNSDLLRVPRTVVRADDEKVGFDTVHADGRRTISYLHWPKDAAVEFIEDGFGFITHGATYWIDKETDGVADNEPATEEAEAEAAKAEALARAAHARAQAIDPSGRYMPRVPNGGSSTAGPFYLPNLIAGIAASVGVIVGSIGPWASLLAFSKNAIGGDGTITLILGCASGVALFTLLNLGRTNAGLGWQRSIASAVSIAGLLCLIIAIIDIHHVLSMTATDVFGVTIRVQVEWGLWMVAISSAALFATALVVAVQVGRANRQATRILPG
jgi:hypothetical protein